MVKKWVISTSLFRMKAFFWDDKVFSYVFIPHYIYKSDLQIEFWALEMPYFLLSISRVSDGQGLRQWWTNAYFFMKAVTGNPKLHLDWKTLENTGNWYLYVHQFIKLVVFGWFCSNIFSNSSFFGVVDMNSITDAAIINRFLKLLFCNRSWFLDITQSKYIITRQQCLKSPEMLILCEAGQNDLQKCPSLTKFLPICSKLVVCGQISGPN